MRVLRSHRSFKIHKAEVGLLKDIAHIAEERAPAVRAVSGSRSCGADGFMRNHVSGHGKADLRQLVRIRHNSRRGTAAANSERDRANGHGNQQQTNPC